MSLIQLRQPPAATGMLEAVAENAPVRIVEIALEQPLPVILPYDYQGKRSYRQARCLVRLHTYPLGIVELSLEGNGGQPQVYAQQIWKQLHEPISEHLRRDGLPPITALDLDGLVHCGLPECLNAREHFLADAPFVSIIVATHERLDTLPASLHSLLHLHYPRYEVIIVDNAPTTGATAEYIEQTYRDDARVRYLREDRQGVSWARNSGIAAARGDIIAITDDDVIADPYWLVELVRAFAVTTNVACVTGLVLPLELETSAQIWFEQYGGFSKGIERRIFDMEQFHPRTPLHPYTMGQCGTGASMAFRAAFLRKIGGFDPALGGSGPARCGQDIATFYQVMRQGCKLVYEPASLLYHSHRRDYASLRKQIYNYGIGITAYLTKCVMENPLLLFDLMIRMPYGLYFILSNHSPKNRRKQAHYPKELKEVELKGMLYGPLAYLKSCRASGHSGQRPMPVVAHPALPLRREHDIVAKTVDK